MTKLALLVELTAKPGREEQLAAFLAGAQPLAVRLDSQTFAIFDAFNDETGRQAHLKGPIAAALMAHADELLASPPQIRNADVLADKVKIGRV